MPYLYTDYKFQYYMREKILPKMGTIFNGVKVKLHPKEGWGAVYDKAVIETNNWLIYGCAKPKMAPYNVTHIWSMSFAFSLQQKINVV